MRTRKPITLAATALAAGLALSACGSDSGGSGGSGGGGDSKALDGVSITVGSKDFTENILLGKILVKAMENAGAKVTDKTNLGGSAVNRQALLAGQINVSPEYNGTGWTVYLKHDDPSQDPKELYDKVAKEDLEKNKLKWVGTSPFNDTYGFAANPDLAKQNGGAFTFQTMADYMKANPNTTLCLETEFPDRPDGLILFEKATKYKVPQSQIKILDTGLIYTETAKGSCQFGEVFTTDGRIKGLNLSLVQDPGVMILYNVSYVFQDAVYEKNAQAYDDMVNKILAPLDNDKMAELNAQVDVDGDSADKVAEDYVKEIGLG